MANRDSFPIEIGEWLLEYVRANAEGGWDCTYSRKVEFMECILNVTIKPGAFPTLLSDLRLDK